MELGLEVPWHEKLVRALVPRGLQLRRALADLRSDDPRVRNGALRSLGILKDPRATKPILDIIDRGYRDWHAFAVQVWLQIGDGALLIA